MVLTKEQIEDTLENFIKKHNTYSITLKTLAIKLNVTKDELFGTLIEILDEEPDFCCIFAKDKNNLYSIKKLTDLSDESLNNILYIYNPIKEKFQIFCKDGYVDYPDWLDRIHDYAFYRCENLTSITIPNSVTSIGSYAFSGCANMTSITLSNSVTSVAKGTFYRCTSLTSITIPNSVTSIGNSAFFYCSSLTNIIIPNSVTKIDKDAFDYCNSNLIVYTKNPYVINYCKKNDINYKEV